MQEDEQKKWGHVPKTCSDAKPIAWRLVSNSVVIQVSKATIRNAIIENGLFELFDPAKSLQSYSGRTRAEVRCLWFGVKPPTSWMHLTLLGPHEEISDFTGEVIANIGLKNSSISK